MARMTKALTALLMTISLGMATVVCCCLAASVTAYFQKAPCGHCMDHKASGKSSSPSNDCHKQLSSGELSHAFSFSPVKSAVAWMPAVFVNHRAILAHLIVSIHPPGGPPLGPSLTPLYLRTFHLRI